MGQKVSVPPASITRLPDHFTKAALESGWFEFGVSVMPKPLIQIIADYYSNRENLYGWREMLFPTDSYCGGTLSIQPGSGSGSGGGGGGAGGGGGGGGGQSDTASVKRIADCVNGSDQSYTVLFSETCIGESGTPRHFAIRLSRIESRTWIGARTDAMIAIGLSDAPQPQPQPSSSIEPSLPKFERFGAATTVMATRYHGFDRIAPAHNFAAIDWSDDDMRLTIGGETTARAPFFRDGDTIGIVCDPDKNTFHAYVNDKRVWKLTEPPAPTGWTVPKHPLPDPREPYNHKPFEFQQQIRDSCVFVVVRGVKLRAKFVDWTPPD